MDAGLKQRVEVALGQVRPGVADLAGAPAVLERVSNLAGRARVDPDEPEPPHEREDLRIALRFEGEAEPERHARSLERARERARLLLDPHEVVREERRAVLARHGFGIASGDEQPSTAHLEPRS